MFDLTTFCHICFKANKKLDNFDSSDADILENLRYIGFETDTLIKETPVKICSDCFYMLNITTNFKQMCVTNNRYLKEYIVKLKNGKQNKRAVLYVNLTYDKLPKKGQDKFRLNVKRAKRQLSVKHLKPIRDLVVDCRVDLERICVVSELRKIKNGGCNYAPNLDGNEVHANSDELFMESLHDKLEDDEDITVVENLVDEQLMTVTETQSEKVDNSAPVKIADVIEIEDENSVDNEMKSPPNVIHVDLDEIFPNPEDEKLKDIIRSLTRISKMSKQTTLQNTKKLAPVNKSIQQLKNKPVANSIEPDCDLDLINKLKTEFNNIFRSLMTYSNKKIDTLSQNEIKNHQNSENTPHNNHQFTTTSEKIFAQLAAEYSTTPRTLTILTPDAINAFQNTPLNHYNNNINRNIPINKQKAPKRTVKTKKTIPENHLNPIPMQQYSNLPIQFNNLNTQQTLLSNATNYNPHYPTHSSPNINYNAYNNPDINNYHIGNMGPLKSNPNIGVAIDPSISKSLDYDNAIVANVIVENISGSSNASAYLADDSGSQLQNLDMTNDLLLNCEVLIDDQEDCESRVLTEKCVLCDAIINSNSNYCQACYSRLDENLRQSNKRECINCCQPLGENASASLFCAKCAKISTWKSLKKNNIFGKEFSHCVVCCNVFENQSDVCVPNFVCSVCGPLGKLSTLKLFDCDLCQYRFLDDTHYISHKKEHESKKFACPICLKLYLNKKSMYSHFRSHSKSKSPQDKFKCSMCDKEYEKPHALRVHVLMHANNNNHISCKHCDLIFISIRHFQFHMKSKHPEYVTTRPRKVVNTTGLL